MRGGRLILNLLVILVAVYIAIIALAFAVQERILFPSYLVLPAGPLPPGAEALEIRTPDGLWLQGIRVPPEQGTRSATLVLVFVGNASNAQGVAEELHEIYPECEVVAFFYRGYAPSGGAAGAEKLLEDARLVYDLVAERLQTQRVVAVGISLGSGIAAGLAARRPLAGLILVTPFDSVAAVARQLYPWLPVSLLLRHDISSLELLRESRLPVAIIAAGRDRLVRPERTQALRRVVPNLVYDATIPDAGHNDIAAYRAFEQAMREAMARIEAAQ
jgi:pimeloyl-ACP methyl ester carboxylesterase